MGIIYQAEDLKLGRRVALKFLPSELALDTSAYQRLQVEARAASQLDHPNICSIYELGEHDGQPFIAMQYLDGQTLREWIERSRGLVPRPMDEVVQIAIQIAAGLEEAHRAAIIHRDIKPANIFLTQRGEVKILDFGVAKLLHPAEPETPVNDRPTASLNRTNASVGTPSYLSPDQIRGEAPDPRTDLFCFGLVLYEMSTGQRAFMGSSAEEIHGAVLNHEPVAPSVINSNISPALEQIIKKSLKKKREERYQSATELIADLRELEKGKSEVAAPPNRLVIKWAIAAAILLAVAIGVYFLAKSPGRQPFKDFTIAQITNTGKAEQAAISPDGKYVLHVQNENGMRSIRLRNIATGSDTEILPPSSTRFKSLTFSPDGNYVYFRQLVNSVGSQWDIKRMPVLGGKTEQVASDVDSDIVFSRDGNKIAYVRANGPEIGKYSALLANTDGSGETVLTTQDIKGFGNDAYPPFLTWSGDGRQIVFSYARMADVPGILRVLNLPGKKFGTFQQLDGLLTFEVRWVRNSRWMLIVSTPKNGTSGAQLGALSVIDHQVHPITRDTSSYSNLTLSADGQTAATVQSNTVEFLEFLKVNGTNASSQELNTSRIENVDSFDWTHNGRLIASDGTKLFFVSPTDGKTEELVGDAGAEVVGLTQCPNSTVLVNYESDEESAIWRVGPGESKPVKISDGKYDMAPSCSPDNTWAYYFDGLKVLKRVPIKGGTGEVIAGANIPNLIRFFGPMNFSSDGRKAVALVGVLDVQKDRTVPKLAIFDTQSGAPNSPKLLECDSRANAGSLHGGGARFTPDGKAIVYAIRDKGVGNLWMQPLDGSAGRQITNYTTDWIAQFRWSVDGRTLAVKRTHTTSDIVVLRDTGK